MTFSFQSTLNFVQRSHTFESKSCTTTLLKTAQESARIRELMSNIAPITEEYKDTKGRWLQLWALPNANFLEYSFRNAKSPIALSTTVIKPPMKQLKKSLLFIKELKQKLGKESVGLAFIDSTILSVCHICRASSHRVFKKITRKGKTSVGYFFGLKLHLVINPQGEIIAWMLTPGNISDLTPVEMLCQKLLGKLFSDKAYISQELFKTLYEKGLQLIARLRSNMENKLMDLWDKRILHKRSLIESVISQLKLQCQIDHHRHRSPMNFFVNLMGGLIAYSLKEDNPHLQEKLVA